MKVLHVSLTDAGGGASIAMQRLHRQLLSKGVESMILTMNKKTIDSTVLYVPDLYRFKDRVYFFFQKVLRRFTNLKHRTYIFSVLKRLDFDIIHLHWIEDDYGDMLSLRDLKSINKPIVISLHDCVSFTGGCHFYNCNGQQENCSGCPMKQYHATSHKSFKLKERWYSILKPYFVAPSRWIQNVALHSQLLARHYVACISHGIDTKLFYPISKIEARRILGYNENDIVLLAGAVSTIDEIKGMSELPQILFEIKQAYPNRNVMMICFGKADVKMEGIDYIGSLSSETDMRVLYNAADVMLVPSKQESFGLTTEEAMSCGTPVVVYNNTGMVDMIQHRISGYVAQRGNIDDFVCGVKACIDNKELGRNARKMIEEQFDGDKTVLEYISLYNRIKN